MLINLTAHLALSGGRVAGSVFALKNGASELTAGILMGLYAFLPVLTALQVGRWVDRAGAYIAIRVGVACVLLGAAVPVIWLSVHALFLSAMFVGFGFNVMSVALQNTVGRLNADVAPEVRLGNFGWFAMSHSLSSTLGPLMAGILIDAFGYRASFASLLVCAAIACVYVLRERAAFPPPTVSAPGAPARSTSVLSLLESPEMRRIYFVSLSLSVVWDLFIVLLPVLGTRLHFSASVIGAVFSFFALGTFVVRFATPWLSERFREWEILRAALLFIALTLGVLPFISHPWMLMAAGFVLGAALGCGQPNMLSLLHTSAPDGRTGEAVGLRSLVGNASSVSVPVAFGAAVATLGIAPILFAGVLMVAGVIPAAHKGVKKKEP